MNPDLTPSDILLKRIHQVACLTLGFIFLYHGVVPKILFLSPTEVFLIEAHPFLAPLPPAWVAAAAGCMEVLLALGIVFWRRNLLPVYMAAASLALLLLDIAVMAPQLLAGAFNPVSLNVAGLCLCWIAAVSKR